MKTRTTTPMAYAERANLAIDHVVGHLEEPLRLDLRALVAVVQALCTHHITEPDREAIRASSAL